MAEAVQHLWPGTKVAIGPGDRGRLLLRLRVRRDRPARPISRASRTRCARSSSAARTPTSAVVTTREEAVARFARRGRDATRSRSPRPCPRASRSRSTSRTASSTSAAARTCRRPSRSRRSSSPRSPAPTGAATRTSTMLTRIYGTAFFDQAELDAHLERIEEARRRDHRRLGRELDLFHLSDTSPGSPFWHPRGMVLFNELGRLLARAEREPRLPRRSRRRSSSAPSSGSAPGTGTTTATRCS